MSTKSERDALIRAALGESRSAVPSQGRVANKKPMTVGLMVALLTVSCLVLFVVCGVGFKTLRVRIEATEDRLDALEQPAPLVVEPGTLGHLRGADLQAMPETLHPIKPGALTPGYEEEK